MFVDPLPHHYSVTAEGGGEGTVTLQAPRVTAIASAPPEEFDGPGDQWSPETLLLAAVADCFLLSFRAVAAASKFEWISLQCETNGTLDRVDRITRFTEITNTAILRIPAGTRESRARSLLEKAEQVCLISNSLNTTVRLSVSLQTDS
jgi:peroxiredoxin-like protein